MTEFESYDDLDELPETPWQESAAIKLADAGLSPEIVAYALDEPVHKIRGIVLRRRPAPVPLIDEKLADGVRKLADAALREAHLILEFGPTEQKMTIIKSMLGGLSRHVATSSSNDTEEARNEFQAMLMEMRTDGIPERDRVVTDDDIIDVEATDVEAPSAASPFDD